MALLQDTALRVGANCIALRGRSVADAALILPRAVVGADDGAGGPEVVASPSLAGSAGQRFSRHAARDRGLGPITGLLGRTEPSHTRESPRCARGSLGALEPLGTRGAIDSLRADGTPLALISLGTRRTRRTRIALVTLGALGTLRAGGTVVPQGLGQGRIRIGVGSSGHRDQIGTGFE